jgi:UDP-sugar pyrophosphorylase
VEGGNNAPGTMSSAESDKYIQNQRKLKFAGMNVPVSEEKDLVKVGGIPVTPGPRVILSPSFAITQQELMDKIDGGRITQRSALVLEGESLKVKNLQLDGALVIKTGHDCIVEVDGLVVENKGFKLKEIPEGADVPETVSIRGYTMDQNEVLEIVITEPGTYKIGPDGVVNKVA